MSNNDLAKVFTRFIVTEGPDDVVEREHTIDDWLKPVHGDGPIHGGSSFLAAQTVEEGNARRLRNRGGEGARE